MHYKKSVFRSLAMVTQLGLSVLTPILLCIYTGYLVDSHFGTKLMVPMLAKNTLLQEQKEDERLRREQQAGQQRSGISKPKQPSRITGAGARSDSKGGRSQ